VTVGDLIAELGGELLVGDVETELIGVEDVMLAHSPYLVFGQDQVSAAKAAMSGAGAAVVPAGFVAPSDCDMALIAVKQPRLWFSKAAALLKLKRAFSGVHPSAVISAEAQLGKDVSVGPGAVIGAWSVVGACTRVEAGAVLSEHVLVGENCHIHPRVVIYPFTGIDNRVIVHAGAVLGADGFGYVRDRETGAYTQFPQQGTLHIEDDVEIGANTTIDRGALSETRIRRGTKIDNLVHIGHNCDIGEDVVIAALTGISGSSTVGKGAVIAGQVGIGDHAHVGPGVILGGQAGVLSGKTVDTTGTVLWGTPAKPLREYLRELATLARLARRKKD
jgi:UDP-3-O-[3-hydroxymyristoyl] glucosamine N-acyltransferase